MKIYNKSGNGLSHSLDGKIFMLANDTIGDIPEAIAKVWLKINGVTEYVAPEDLAKLKAENEALKAKVKEEKEEAKEEKAKPAKKTAKKTTKKDN